MPYHEIWRFSAWSEALQYFLDQGEEFDDEYHQRSNTDAESTIEAFKKPMPAPLQTMKFAAQTNEVLCKVLDYTLCGVGREVSMRGITLDYPAEAESLERRIAAAVVVVSVWSSPQCHSVWPP